MITHRIYFATVTLILLAAVFFRFYKLGQVPVSLYWDEVAMAVDAKSIAQTGLDMHSNHWQQLIFPSYGDYKLPVYIWLAAVGFKLLNNIELTVRLPSAVAGLLSVITAWLLMMELLRIIKIKPKEKNIYKLSSLLVMAVAPWSIVFSRVGFEGHLAQFFLSLSILILLWSERKKYLLWLVPLLGVIATYTYYSVRFVWPVVFIAAVVLIVLKKITLAKLLQTVLVPLIIFWLLLLPMTRSSLYQISNQFRLSTSSILNIKNYPLIANQYRAIAGNTLTDRIFFHRDWLMIKEFFTNASDNLSLNFLFLNGDPNLRHGTGNHGLFLLIFFLFLPIGFYFLYDKNKKIWLFLSIWWLVALIPASVPETTPHALRSLNALMPLVLIIAFGIGLTITKIGSIKKRLARILLFSIFFSSIIISVTEFGYYYFNFYPAQSAIFWQSPYKQLAQEILKHKNEVELVYVVNIDPRFYLWLMAYGSNTGYDFQSWPSKDYQFSQIDNIDLESQYYPVQKENLVMVVVPFVDKPILNDDKEIISATNISDPLGLKKYSLLIIQQL